MMKVSLILEAVNRITGPMGAAVRSVERLGAMTRSVSRIVGTSFGSMRDFTRDATAHFRRLAGEEGMGRAARSAAYLRNQVSGLTAGITMLKYASVAAVVGLGGEFVGGVFKAGGEMDQMLVTLTKIEHGGNNARKAMAWMRNSFAFGAGAQFSFPDIMKSYQLAKESGMNPQGGSLAAMADMAAAWRVPLGRVIFAVKDAMVGVTRPLAMLGISLHHSKGGPARFAYQTNDGKNVEVETPNNGQSILAMIQRIIAIKYGGIAAAQANTVPGRLAELKKLLYVFQSNVWSSGVGDWAMSRLNQLLAMLKTAANDGTWDKFAKRISNFITGTGDKLFSFLMQTNWASVGNDLKALAVSIGAVASAVGFVSQLGGGGLSGMFNMMIVGRVIGLTTALTGFAPALGIAAGALFGFDVAASPIIGIITAIIIGVGLLAGAAYLVWANWGQVSAFFKRLWKGLPGWIGPAVKAAMLALSPFMALAVVVMDAWKPLTGFFSRLWSGILSTFSRTTSWLRTNMPLPMMIAGKLAGAAGWGGTPAAPRPGPPRASPLANTRTTQVGGTMTIQFKNAPKGMTVTELKSHHPEFAIAMNRMPVLPTY